MALRSRSITSAGPTKPQGLTSAQLNLPFCVATLLLEGDVFVDEFTPDCVDDEARIALSRKVKVVHDPAITAQGAGFRHKVRVDIHFRDGSVESETREAPRGSEQSFASADDIVAKFRKLTRGVMDGAATGRAGGRRPRHGQAAGQPHADRTAADQLGKRRRVTTAIPAWPPTGIFGADLFSVITSSKSLPLRCHWPATSGVLVTFFTGCPVHFTGPTID